MTAPVERSSCVLNCVLKLKVRCRVLVHEAEQGDKIPRGNEQYELGLRHTYGNETILKGCQLGEAVLDDRIQHMCKPDVAGTWGR